MSKTITSPVKKWPGEVVLSDPLTFTQSFAFEDALEEVKKLGKDVGLSRKSFAWLSGIIACVEEWHLGGDFPERPTPDNWPATPKTSRLRLITWLVNEISQLYNEADEIPNA